MVCRELLRKHPNVIVRALVRSAKDPWNGYGRLSYEVGAEDGKMEIGNAFRINEDTGRFLSPQTVEFDADVQAGYGLDRLEIRECELRYNKDVKSALGDVDGVIWCATAFNQYRSRAPDRLDEIGGRIARSGANLFELRLGKALFGEASADGMDKERQDEARDKTADIEGLELATAVLASTRRRRASLAELTGGAAADAMRLGVPLVVASASSSLGYDEDRFSGELVENEFGYRKRMGEAAVRSSQLPHVIVRSAIIDDVRTAEGLPLQVTAALSRTCVHACVHEGQPLQV